MSLKSVHLEQFSIILSFFYVSFIVENYFQVILLSSFKSLLQMIVKNRLLNNCNNNNKNYQMFKDKRPPKSRSDKFKGSHTNYTK